MTQMRQAPCQLLTLKGVDDTGNTDAPPASSEKAGEEGFGLRAAALMWCTFIYENTDRRYIILVQHRLATCG